MRLKIGDFVLYNQKVYRIIHIYISNYCEIRDDDTFRTILVHADEVKLLNK